MPRDDLLEQIDPTLIPPPKTQTIAEIRKKSPDYIDLEGPHYLGGFTTPEAELPEKDEGTTEPGFPIPEVQDYGATEAAWEAREPEIQGVIDAPTVPEHKEPSWLRSALRRGFGRLYWQIEKASQRPDGYYVKQAVAVPDGAGLPVVISGRNTWRHDIVLSNTGSNPIYVGPTANDAEVNGFTIASGGALTLDSQAPVYAYAASGAASTVDVIETYYSTRTRAYA